MKDLLRLEFRKLKRQKSFYIIFAIMIAFVVLSALTMKLLESLADQINEVGETFGESFTVSGESVLLGFVSSSNFTILAAIFVAIVVCDDYENGIIKNIFARGYSRSEFFFAKFVYLIATTSIMIIAAITVSGIMGVAFFGINGDAGKIILLIFVQYFACMASVALFFAVSVIIKKLGGSIAINIIAPIVIELLLSLANSLLKIDGFSFGDVWISSFTTSLAVITVETGRIIVCAILSAAYIVAFTATGYIFSEKTEV